MFVKTTVLLLALLGYTGTVVHAQDPKVAVEVIDRSEGTVGERLVYRVKEDFRKSAEFRLTDENQVRIQVIINAMPKFSDNENTATVYGIVWNIVYTDSTGNWMRGYYDSTVGYAGTDVVDKAAETIVSGTDRIVTDVRKSVRQ